MSNDAVGDVKDGENINPEGRDRERNSTDLRGRGNNHQDASITGEIPILPPPHPPERFEEAGGGGWRGLLRAALRMKEQHANVSGSGADGDSEGRQGQHPGTDGADANGNGGGNEHVGREMRGGGELEPESGGGGGGNKRDSPNLDIPEKVPKDSPQNLESSEQDAGDGMPSSPENEEEGSSVQLQRSPPQEYWDSVEGAGLSTVELEGVVGALTEEEAESLLREEGMVDSNGNLKRENTG